MQQDEPAIAEPADDAPAPGPQMPLGIVISRIVVVSGMSFAAALAIFFIVGALWLPALAAAGVTLIFLFLMFSIERRAGE